MFLWWDICILIYDSFYFCYVHSLLYISPGRLPRPHAVTEIHPVPAGKSDSPGAFAEAASYEAERRVQGCKGRKIYRAHRKKIWWANFLNCISSVPIASRHHPLIRWPVSIPVVNRLTCSCITPDAATLSHHLIYSSTHRLMDSISLYYPHFIWTNLIS